MEEARGDGEEEWGGSDRGGGQRVDVACGMERMRQIMIKKKLHFNLEAFFVFVPHEILVFVSSRLLCPSSPAQIRLPSSPALLRSI